MKLSKLKFRNAKPSQAIDVPVNVRPVSLRLRLLVLPVTVVVLALLLAFPGVRHSLYPSSPDAASSAPERLVISPNTHTDGQRWWNIADSFRDGSTQPGAGGIARLFENSAAARAVQTFYDDGILGALRAVQTIIDGGFSRLLQAELPPNRTSTTTLTVNLATDPPPDRSLSTVEVMQPTPEQRVEFDLIISAEDGAGDGKALDGIDLDVRLIEGDATLGCPPDAELCDPMADDTLYTLQRLSVGDTGFAIRAVSATLVPTQDSTLRVTVTFGSIRDELLISLRAAEPRRLERLELVADAPPAPQARPGEQVRFVVDLKSFDNYDDPYAVADLSFSAVLDRGTLVSPQGVETLALDQSGVTRRTITMVPETMQDTTLTLTFSDGVITTTLVRRIQASPLLVLGSLMIRPETASLRQSNIEESTVIQMEVIPLDQRGDPIRVGSLRVSVTANNRAEIIFPVGGTAVIGSDDDGFFGTQVEVLARGQDTDISITFSSLDGVVSKTVQRRIEAVPSAWDAVQIEGPTSPPTQAAVGEEVSFDIVIRTVDEYLLPFASAELQLEVAVSEGAMLLTPSRSEPETITPLSGPDYSISRTIVVVPPRGLEATATITVRGIRTADGTVISTTLTQKVLPAPRILSALMVTVTTPPPAQESPDAEISFVIKLGARDNYDARIAAAGLELSVQASDGAVVESSATQTVSLGDSGTTTLAVTVTPQIGRDTTVTITLSDPVTGLVQLTEQQVIATADRVLSELAVMVATPPLAQSRPELPVSFEIELGAFDNYGARIAAADLVLSVDASEDAVVLTAMQSVSLGDSGPMTVVVTVRPQPDRDTTVTITLSDPVTGRTQSAEQKVIAAAARVLSELTVMVSTPPLAQSRPEMPVSFDIEISAIDNYREAFAATGLELSVEASDGAVVESSMTQSISLDDSGTMTVVVTVTPQPGMDTTVTITLSALVTGLVQLTEQQVIATADRVLSELAVMVVTQPSAQSRPEMPVSFEIKLSARDNYDLPIAADLELSVEASGGAVVESSMTQSVSLGDSGTTILAVTVRPQPGLDTTVTITLRDPAAPGLTQSAEQRVAAAAAGVLSELAVMVVTQPSAQSRPEMPVSFEIKLSARDNYDLPIAADLELSVEASGGAVVESPMTQSVSLDDSGTTILAVTVRPQLGLDTTVTITLRDPAAPGLTQSVEQRVAAAAAGVLSELAVMVVTQPSAQSRPEMPVSFEIKLSARDNYDLLIAADLELSVEASGGAVVESSMTQSVSLDDSGTTILAVTVRPQPGLDTTVTITLRDPAAPGLTQSVEQRVAAAAAGVLSELAVMVVTQPSAQSRPEMPVSFEIKLSARDNYDLPIAADLELSVEASGGAVVESPMTQSVSLDDSGTTILAVTVRPQPGMDTTVTITLRDPAAPGLTQSVEQRVAAAAAGVLSELAVMVSTPPLAQSRPEMPVSFEIKLSARDNYDLPIAADLGLSVEASDGAVVESSMTQSVSLDDSGTTILAVTVRPQPGMDTTVTITLRDPAAPGLTQSVEQRVAAAAAGVLSELAVMVSTPPLAQSRPEMPVSFEIKLSARDNYDLPIAADLELLVAAGDGAEVVSTEMQSISLDDSGITTLVVTVTPQIGRDTTVMITLSDPAGLVPTQLTEQRVIATAARVLSELEVMVDTPPLAQTLPDMPISFVIELGTRDNYGARIAAADLVLSVEASEDAVVSTEMQSVSLDDSGTMTLAVTVTPQIARDTTVTITLSDPAQPGLTQSTEQRVIATAARVLTGLRLSVVRPPIAQLLEGDAIYLELQIETEDNYGMLFAVDDLQWSATATEEAVLPEESGSISVGASGIATQTVSVRPQLGRDTTVTVTVSGGMNVMESISRRVTAAVPGLLAKLGLEVIGDVAEASTPGSVVDIQLRISATDASGAGVEAAGLVFSVVEVRAGVPGLVTTKTVSVDTSGILQQTLSVVPGKEGLVVQVEVSGFAGVDGRVIMATPTPFEIPVRGAESVLQSLILELLSEPERQDQIGSGEAVVVFELEITAFDDFDLPFPAEDLEFMVTLSGDAELRSAQSGILSLGSLGEARQLVVEVALQMMDTTVTVTVNSGTITASLEQQIPVPRLSELQIKLPADLPADLPRQESPDTAVDFEIGISATDNYDFPIAADDLALSVTADEGAMVTTPMQIVSLDNSGSTTVVVTVTPEIGRDTTVIIVVRGSVDNSISATAMQQVTAAELRRLERLTVAVTTTPSEQALPESPVEIEIRISAFDNYDALFAATDLVLSVEASDGAVLVSAMMDTLSVDTSGSTIRKVMVMPQNGFDTTVTITVRDSVDNSIMATVLQRLVAADRRVLSNLVIERLGFPVQLLVGEVVELLYEIRATDNYGMLFAFDGLQWLAETRFVTIPAEFPGGSRGTFSVDESGVAVLTVAVIPPVGVGDPGILFTVDGENANGETIDYRHAGLISVPVAERLALLELKLIGDVPEPSTAGAAVDIPLRISARDSLRSLVAAPGLMLSVDVGAGRLVSPAAMTIVDVSTSGRTVPLRVVPGRSGFTLTVVVSGFADLEGRSEMFPDGFELPIEDRLERRIAGSPPVLQSLAVKVVSGSEPRREDQMVSGTTAAVVVFEVDISAMDDSDMAFPAEELLFTVMQSGDAQLLSPETETFSLDDSGKARRVVKVALQTMDTTVTVTLSSGTITASLEQKILAPRLTRFEITPLVASPQQALPEDAVVLEFRIETFDDNYDLPIAADNLLLEVTVSEDATLLSSQTQTFSVSASGSIVLTVRLVPEAGTMPLMLRVSDSANGVVGVLSQPVIVIGADAVALTRFVVGFTEELQPQSEIGEQTDAMISIAARDNYDRRLAVANVQLAVQIEGEGAILLSQGSEVLELGTDGLSRALSFLSIAGRAATLTVTVSSGDVTGRLVSDVSGVELRSPQSSVSAALSTGTVRAGAPFGLDVSYLAPPNMGEEVRRLLIYLFYDSRVLDFVSTEGLLQTGLVATPMEGDAQADTGDQDGNMATDRVLVVRWMQAANGWPGVALPAKLLTAMFASRGYSSGAVNTELGVLATISTAHFRVATVPVVITTPTARIPDVNGNNRVDVNDLVVLKRFFAAVASNPSVDLTDPQQMAALIFNIAGATAADLSAFPALLDPDVGRVLDISGDGLFDRTDSLWLFRYLSGIGRSGMPDTFDRAKARQILGLSSLSR